MARRAPQKIVLELPGHPKPVRVPVAIAISRLID
jgi:hypothetical protein